MTDDLVDTLRAVALGAVVALAGVLVGAGVIYAPAEWQVAGAIVLAVLAVALGVDVGRITRRIRRDPATATGELAHAADALERAD